MSHEQDRAKFHENQERIKHVFERCVVIDSAPDSPLDIIAKFEALVDRVVSEGNPLTKEVTNTLLRGLSATGVSSRDVNEVAQALLEQWTMCMPGFEDGETRRLVSAMLVEDLGDLGAATPSKRPNDDGTPGAKSIKITVKPRSTQDEGDNEGD
jgi:hypothetical protein